MGARVMGDLVSECKPILRGGAGKGSGFEVKSVLSGWRVVFRVVVAIRFTRRFNERNFSTPWAFSTNPACAEKTAAKTCRKAFGSSARIAVR